MPSETPALDLLAALRSALLSTDLAKLESLWQQILASSPTMQRQAARLLRENGLPERAAQLYEQQGDLTSAQAVYQQAGLFFDAGRLAQQLGDERTAEALYRQSIVEPAQGAAPRESDTADGPTLRLGMLLLRQGRAEEAVPFLQTMRKRLLAQKSPPLEPLSALLDDVETALAQAFQKLQLPEVALSLLHTFRLRHPDAPLTVADWLLTRPIQPPEAKLLLGRYRLQKLLGAGAMGRVFLADDMVGGRPVALKLLPLPVEQTAPDSRWQLFCREAQILRTLRHPNIVAVQDFSDSAGVLVMELLRGGSLGEQPLPLSLTKTRRVLLDVCAGLSVAHAASVLHRDLKPHNLFLDDAHNTKIGDFGAALLAQLGATQTESLVGTLAYMSPEQLEGQPLTVASDLYSLGVTLFQLLTGRLPFLGPDWVSQHIQQPAPDPRAFRPSLPVAWAELCLQLLAKSAADRPPTTDALRLIVQRLPLDEDRDPRNPIEGKLPSADDGLQPHVEPDPPPPNSAAQTLLCKTDCSTVYHVIDAKLARGVLIERFDRDKLATERGQQHLRWLRVMARLGGPGLQRVLRIALDGPGPEVHYEESVGVPLHRGVPIQRHDEPILLLTLRAIHAAGEVHGDIGSAVIVEKHGASIQVVGRGPLHRKEAAPTQAAEEAELLETIRSAQPPVLPSQ